MSRKLLKQPLKQQLDEAVLSKFVHLETLSVLFSVSAELLYDVWVLPIFSLAALRTFAPVCAIKEEDFCFDDRRHHRALNDLTCRKMRTAPL